MEYSLYPVTLNYWANYYMAQWDIYSQVNPMHFEILINEIPGQIPLFKSDIIEDF